MVFYVSGNKHCLCKISVTCLKTAVKWPWHHNERVNLVTSQTNVFTIWYGEIVAPVHDNAVKFNMMLTVLMWCMTPNTPCKGPFTWHALTAWEHWWTRFLYEILMRIVHLKDKAERISTQGSLSDEKWKEAFPVFRKCNLLFDYLISNWHSTL